MDKTRLPNYTLRYHKSRVTVLKFIQLPQDFVLPTLVSGDASGQLVLWDLATRRPITTYSIEKSPEIVAVQYLDDYLLAILSKDHKLHILKVHKEDATVMKRQSSSFELPPAYSLQECYHVPINTLNFANFLLQNLGDSLYRLICCNTQDSDSIDIYTFHLSDLHSLRRIRKGVNFYEIIRELLSKSEAERVNKLGIVMKFTQCNDIIYCGLESGYIIGFKMHDNLELLSSKSGDTNHYEFMIEIVYISAVHHPNPVLDLFSVKDNVLSSSVDAVIGTHQVTYAPNNEVFDELDYTTRISDHILYKRTLKVQADNFKKSPVAQVSHIIELNEYLILGCWSGNTVVVKQDGQITENFFKSKSNVLVNESAQGNLQGNGQISDKDKRFYKICSLTGLSKRVSETSVQTHLAQPLSVGHQRRVTNFLDESWCVIGYEDGGIVFHQI